MERGRLFLSPRSGERVPSRVGGEAGEGPMRGPRPRLSSKVRRLRRNSTDAESFKFVRQEPIGPYVADFVCRDHKLVLEVDGGQHAESARDAARDRFLRGEGYRILRFWNTDVLQNREGVLSAILNDLGRREDAPHPARS